MENSVYTGQQSATRRVEETWGSLTWLASRDLGNAADLTLGRVVIRRGCANPSHCHPNCEEVLYLLHGRLEHYLGPQKILLAAGDTLHIPASVLHHAANIGDDDADMIVAYSAGTRQIALESG